MLEDVVLLLIEGVMDAALLADLVPDIPPSSIGRDEPPEFAVDFANATQAIEDNPSDSRAYFVRAVISQARRHHQRALADLREVFRLDPGSARAWMLLSEVL